MSPERWHAIKRIFDEIVDRPAPEQQDILNQACAGDTEMRRELEQMLAADAQPLLDDSPFFTNNDPLYFKDKKIGRYRILEEVGRGGMGAVFAAVRADGEFDQKVALKIINSGANTNVIVRRFRNERQILASLQHPHIAHLIDGGLSEDRVPFFVMEFVTGVPIDAYCAECELDLSEKLGLFRQVCEAVSYAHGRLIVHRDLKPSNILVKDDGQVKLLDFGIAKVLSQGENGAQQTATQLGMMTPNYASPEQIRGEAVTTSTDVYSLGVILYELLTGSLPYDLTGLRLDEMLRIVSHTEPSKPSDAERRRRGDTGTRRRVSPLRGDLDNIVLKALRKEPAQRYASAEQFSEDIRRYLSGLPVVARRATFGYKAGKFIRRNRIAVGLSALVFVFLVGGIAATGWQAVRAERERKLAEKRFEQSRKLANSLVFKYHDAIANLPNSSPVRELLLKDASAYLDDLAADAKGNVGLQHELASAYMKLGDIQGRPHGTSTGNTAGALESYEKAVSLFEAIARSFPTTHLDVRQELLAVYRNLATTLARANENEHRRGALFKMRLDILEELLKEQPDNFKLKIEMARMHVSRANGLLKVNFEQGYRYYQERVFPFLAEAERVAPDDADVINLRRNVSNDLGWYFSEHGRLLQELGESPQKSREYFQRSLEFFQQAEKISAARYQSDPGKVLYRRGLVVGICNVGIALRDVDRIEEAFEFLLRGRALHEEELKFDPNNLQAVFDLGDSYDSTAFCHLKKANYAKAISDFETSLAYMERVINADPKHHEAINYKLDLLVQLGNAYAEAGKFTTAFQYYEQAKSFGTKLLTEEPGDRVQLGRVYLNAGRSYTKFAEKESSAARSRELWKKAQTELLNAAEIIEHANALEFANQLRVVKNQLAKCDKALE